MKRTLRGSGGVRSAAVRRQKRAKRRQTKPIVRSRVDLRSRSDTLRRLTRDASEVFSLETSEFRAFRWYGARERSYLAFALPNTGLAALEENLFSVLRAEPEYRKRGPQEIIVLDDGLDEFARERIVGTIDELLDGVVVRFHGTGVEGEPVDGNGNGQGDGAGHRGRQGGRGNDARGGERGGTSGVTGFGLSGAVGGFGAGGSGGDDGDDRDQNRRRRRAVFEADELKQNDQDEDDEKDSGEDGDDGDGEKRRRIEIEDIVSATSSRGTSRSVISLRNGLSLNDENRASNPELLRIIYGENLAIYQFFLRSQGQSELLDSYEGERPPQGQNDLALPPCLFAELVPSDVDAIRRAMSPADLMRRFKAAENISAYIAAVIHGRGELSGDEQRIAELFRLILSREESDDDTIFRELPDRYNEDKQEAVLANLRQIQRFLLDSEIAPFDYGSQFELDREAALLAEALRKDITISVLSDYANTLYSQFRDAMILPWRRRFNRTLTNDNSYERLLGVYAAQVALLASPVRDFAVDGPVFRWAEGIEDYFPGDLLSNTVGIF